MQVSSESVLIGLSAGLFIAGFLAIRCGNKPNAFICRTSMIFIIATIVAILSVVIWRKKALATAKAQ